MILLAAMVKAMMGLGLSLPIELRNSSGVTGGPFLLLVDGSSELLLVDGVSRLLITGTAPGGAYVPTYYILGF